MNNNKKSIVFVVTIILFLTMIADFIVFILIKIHITYDSTINYIHSYINNF